MAIWFAPFTLADLRPASAAGLAARLGIAFTAIGDDWLEATMPVDERTRQPLGLLHGGASLALVETVATAAAGHCVDSHHYRCRVRESNGNHVRGIGSGLVTATARARHLGASSQVWQVDIGDAAARLVCTARVTIAVVARG